jgi:hypothetical protein
MAKVKAVRYAGIEDTYDLTVKDHHNFSICGGLIVHNCVESIRYGCMSRHPEYSRLEALNFPKGTSEADKDRIRSNLDFAKVYSKMQNQGSIRGGW